MKKPALGPGGFITIVRSEFNAGKCPVCVGKRSASTFRSAPKPIHNPRPNTRPELVLALGQAEGRCDISVERVAINIMDARIADNAGAQPIDQPVEPGGPAAYFSTLPSMALGEQVAALRCALNTLTSAANPSHADLSMVGGALN